MPRPYEEGKLIGYAYDYEQAAKHRRPSRAAALRRDDHQRRSLNQIDPHQMSQHTPWRPTEMLRKLDLPDARWRRTDAQTYRENGGNFVRHVQGA